MSKSHDLSNFIWAIADLLRGAYRPPQYERVMLPLVVLRRFDCVLEPTKEKVLARYAQEKDRHQGKALDAILDKVAGQRFHNHSPLTFSKLLGDPDHVHKHLASYIHGFSENVHRIFEYFEFDNEIERMKEHNILFLVLKKFGEVNLHPNEVDNIEMGLLFEDLIRRFNEQANETAGDHFTPREVIRLMVSLLFIDDDELLSRPNRVSKLLDPTCGTGGMLSEARKYLRQHNLGANLYVYGQDYNKRSYAVAASDLLLRTDSTTRETSTIFHGDTLVDDRFPNESFDYFLSNPPFGVDWKRQKTAIEREHDKLGMVGRFGAGLPRVNDGALLFLQHMVRKFEEFDPARDRHGSRLAIVFNGSPLFTGGAGSGESDIRKWIIENDWLEAIVALPEQMFFNTGIGTYVWIVTNRKEARRKGRIQLLDARDCWISLRRSLGDKRRKLAEASWDAKEPDRSADDIPFRGVGTTHGFRDDIKFLTQAYGQKDRAALVNLDQISLVEGGKLVGRELTPHPTSKADADPARQSIVKIFDNADFGYNRLTIERPLRLSFQITFERKEMFLDVCPALLDDINAIESVLGKSLPPQKDWNLVWKKIQTILHELDSSWRKPQEKAFRDAFTEVDPTAEPVVLKGSGKKVVYEPDPKLRDFENVPLKIDVQSYFEREVLPHVPDAWIDHEKTKVGYEINFNRHFYRYTAPRPLSEIDKDLRKAEEEIVRLLREVVG